MRIRFVLAVGVAALMLAGCSSEQGSESSDGLLDSARGLLPVAKVDGPSWSEYMPVRSERICTYSTEWQHDEELDMSMYSAATSEYTDVAEEADGTHFTLRTSTQITSSSYDEDLTGSSEPFLFSEVLTENLSYVMGDDGLLRAEPDLANEGPLNASYDEFIVYPSIKEIRDGESASSSMTASVSSANPAQQEEIEEGLEPGESEMELRVDYKVTGKQPKEITTPAGKYKDVVGVAIEPKDVEALNASEEASREMKEMTKLIAELAGTTTVWFARDVGVVQTGIEGGMASGTPPVKLENCDEPDDRFQQAWSGKITGESDDWAPGSSSEHRAKANTMPVEEMTGSLVGEEVGEVRSSEGCTFGWILEEVDKHSVMVEQSVKKNKGFDECTDGIPVTLSPQEDGALEYRAEWDDDGGSTGTLTPQESS